MYKQLIVSLFLLIISLKESGYREPACLQQLHFFVGEWAMQTRDLQPDGSYTVGKAISKARFILDHTAIQDDFNGLNQSGEIVFRGTSIRSCQADKPGVYIITWLMPGKEGLSDLRATRKQDILSGEGKGYDDYGDFLERFEYLHITDSSYSFRMHRSYDGGKTWLKNFAMIEATKKQ